MIAQLMDDRKHAPAFSLAAAAPIGNTDPETIATRYLRQALASTAIPSLTAPQSGSATSEFKSLGTETIPLTNTVTVKFRQTLNKIPVYGSLVTVELDNANNLISIGSAVGEPTGVSPVAKLSPAAAVSAVQEAVGTRANLDGIVPALNYYYDRTAAIWRLVFILENVPIASSGEKKDPPEVLPRYMDYVVDANTGQIVAELPRTSSMAVSIEDALDGLGRPRSIQVEIVGNKKELFDSVLNVQTFDFNFDDPEINEAALPGAPVTAPPAWPPSAVSAHANAAAVAKFLRETLRRNNIDNQGGVMKSSINCVVASESTDGQQWFNAFWNSTQMVYGQRQNGPTMMSLSVDLDVVGHEMFHGVTERTARLEYVSQSGALNESMSDIFGVIIANFSNPDPRTWDWKVGEGLSPSGKAFRDMSDPPAFDQPEHMNDFRMLPETRDGDNGGVHANSGIHNKAAFNIMTAVDAAGNLVFTPAESAAIFYLTLTQQLSRTSQFSDSRRGALLSAGSLFRAEPEPKRAVRLDAVSRGFDLVGIT
jgi:Zn-dependent metalloprotease